MATWRLSNLQAKVIKLSTVGARPAIYERRKI